MPRARTPILVSILAALTLLVAPAGASAAVTRVQRTSEVVYETVGDVSLAYDVVHPAGDDRAPVVVLLHGGGWWRGGRADLIDARPLAQAFARAGFAAVVPDYRLACATPDRPRTSFGLSYVTDPPLGRCGAFVPDQVADVRAAIRHVRDHAGTLHVDPRRIALFGVSAGGHLALLSALGAGDDDPHVRAVVDVSGPTATGFIRTQEPRPTAPVRTIRAAFTNAVGCLPAACPDSWAAADPMHQLGRNGTGRFDLLAIAGLRETQVPAYSMQPFVRRMRASGHVARLVAVPNSCHGAGCIGTRPIRRSPSTLAQVVRFLRDTM